MGGFSIAAVDAKDKLGPGTDCRLDLARIETVDRDAKSFGNKNAHGVADPGPGAAGIAPDVDDVRAAESKTLGFIQKLPSLQARGMIDFRQDLDVVSAIVFPPASGLAECLGQVAQICRSADHRPADLVFQLAQVAGTESGDKDAVDVSSHGEVPADP